MKDFAHFLVNGSDYSQGAGFSMLTPPLGFVMAQPKDLLVYEDSDQKPPLWESLSFSVSGCCPERKSSMITLLVQLILLRNAPCAETVLALGTGQEGVHCIRGHASQCREAGHEANKQMNNRGTWRECCFAQGTEQRSA